MVAQRIFVHFGQVFELDMPGADTPAAQQVVISFRDLPVNIR